MAETQNQNCEECDCLHESEVREVQLCVKISVSQVHTTSSNCLCSIILWQFVCARSSELSELTTSVGVPPLNVILHRLLHLCVLQFAISLYFVFPQGSILEVAGVNNILLKSVVF